MNRQSTVKKLDELPFDILCAVFVSAQWPSLAFVSRVFFAVSQSMAVRARFYIAEFGRKNVLDGRLGLPARRPHLVRQDVVLLLLNLGADPRADAQWVLRHAVAQAWTPIVRKVLSMRRPVKSSDGLALDSWRGGSGDTSRSSDEPLLANVHDDDDMALRIAAGLGHMHVARLLLDAHANIEASDGEPLALAASNGHIDMVRLLMSHGADARAAHSRALRRAVLTGDAAVECVRLLLDHGADARVMNDSCLLAACYKGDGEFPVPPLLDKSVLGVESAALLKYSYAGVPNNGALYATPAIAAAVPMPPRAPRRYRNFAERSSADRMCPTPVHTASASTTPAQAMTPGVNMDAPTVSNHTHATVPPVTHIGVVRLLLAHGVDANAQGGRPLVYASSKGWVRVAAVLLAYGADVHVRNDEPLREAAEHGHVHIVRLLIAAGASVGVDNDAPLCDAARGGHLDVVCELLAHGARASGPNGILAHGARASGPNGILALRAAARGGWPNVVQELISAGADPDDSEFRAIAMRSREIRAILGIAHEPSYNRFLFQ
ncbi:hypothetical protein IWW56_001257 [Coemansia sp. RSA 2131]|nr:hypothetical protein IWW56_001257 [Coemansia sp. RSA 2131]